MHFYGLTYTRTYMYTSLTPQVMPALAGKLACEQLSGTMCVCVCVCWPEDDDINVATEVMMIMIIT